MESITIPAGSCKRKTTSVACASNWNDSVVAASERTDAAFTCPDESVLLICSICCIGKGFVELASISFAWIVGRVLAYCGIVGAQIPVNVAITQFKVAESFIRL